MAHLAGIAGLAPIVGAFAAGLILEPVHFQRFGERNIHHLEEALRPLSEFLAPVFFVQMGAKGTCGSSPPWTRCGSLSR